MMFWRRSLMPVETGFVQRLFGTALDELLPGMRLHVRRLGDTRRALSLGGGRIYLPRSFFEHRTRIGRCGLPTCGGRRLRP
jgi:hypothetical protein